MSCTIVNPSDTSLSLGASSLTAPTTTDERSGLAFVSTLNALDAWVIGGNIEGLAIAEWTLNRGSVTLGVIKVYLARSTANNNNLLGYVVEYDGASGSYTCSFQFHLNMSYVGGDVVSTSAFVPVPAGILTGQYIRKSATGWEAASITSGGGGSSTLATQWIDIGASGWSTTGAQRTKFVDVAGIPDANKVVGVFVVNQGVRKGHFSIGGGSWQIQTNDRPSGARGDDNVVFQDDQGTGGRNRFRIQIYQSISAPAIFIRSIA